MKHFIKWVIPLFTFTFCTKASHASFYADIGFGGVFSTAKNSVNTSVKSMSMIRDATIFSLSDVTWRNDFKNGFNMSAATGYHFNSRWAGELEFLYQNIERQSGVHYISESINRTTNIISLRQANDINTVNRKAKLYSLFTNVTYDFYYTSKYSMFIGGGIGISWLQSGIARSYNSVNRVVSPSLLGTAFSWQLKAGISREVFDNLLLILQYRFLDTNSFKAKYGFVALNFGADNENLFSAGPYNIKGVITNALEFKVRYNFC